MQVLTSAQAETLRAQLQGTPPMVRITHSIGEAIMPSEAAITYLQRIYMRARRAQRIPCTKTEARMQAYAALANPQKPRTWYNRDGIGEYVTIERIGAHEALAGINAEIWHSKRQ